MLRWWKRWDKPSSGHGLAGKKHRSRGHSTSATTLLCKLGRPYPFSGLQFFPLRKGIVKHR